MPAEPDRHRHHTARRVLARIDDDVVATLTRCGERGEDAMDHRLAALDREWDLDRVIETEAAGMGLLGLAVGLAFGPRLLALPGLVAAGLLLNATTGHYPLLPLFRRLGVRSAKEIARERYAVKALRGDFAGMVDDAEASARAAAAPVH